MTLGGGRYGDAAVEASDVLAVSRAEKCRPLRCCGCDAGDERENNEVCNLMTVTSNCCRRPPPTPAGAAK